MRILEDRNLYISREYPQRDLGARISRYQECIHLYISIDIRNFSSAYIYTADNISMCTIHGIFQKLKRIS